MKHTLTTTQAAELLLADEYAAWTRAGALALVEYLESVEDDTGEPIEFDRVAIRCDYSEYKSALEAASEWGYKDDDPDADEREDAAAAWLEARTTLIRFDGGVIVQQL